MEGRGYDTLDLMLSVTLLGGLGRISQESPDYDGSGGEYVYAKAIRPPTYDEPAPETYESPPVASEPVVVIGPMLPSPYDDGHLYTTSAIPPIDYAATTAPPPPTPIQPMPPPVPVVEPVPVPPLPVTPPIPAPVQPTAGTQVETVQTMPPAAVPERRFIGLSRKGWTWIGLLVIGAAAAGAYAKRHRH